MPVYTCAWKGQCQLPQDNHLPKELSKHLATRCRRASGSLFALSKWLLQKAIQLCCGNTTSYWCTFTPDFLRIAWLTQVDDCTSGIHSIFTSSVKANYTGINVVSATHSTSVEPMFACRVSREPSVPMFWATIVRRGKKTCHILHSIV